MVTKSALELTSYKLHTLVICVSSNFLCTVLCKILRYQLSSYVILHFNKHNYSCIFVFSLFDSLCPKAVPVCPGTRGKLKVISKNKKLFYTYKCLFYRTLYINFFNILTPKIRITSKYNHIYNIHTLGDTSARPEVRGTADVGWRSLFPLPLNPPRTHSQLYHDMCLRTDGQ